jgi:hypothetical protein
MTGHTEVTVTDQGGFPHSACSNKDGAERRLHITAAAHAPPPPPPHTIELPEHTCLSNSNAAYVHTPCTSAAVQCMHPYG